MRVICVVACWLVATGVTAADADSVSVAGFVTALAKQNNFEVVGLNATGQDTFSPFKKQVSLDRSLGKALARYNYIVNYGNGRIIRVVILGPKGASVGALPDDVPFLPEPSGEASPYDQGASTQESPPET